MEPVYRFDGAVFTPTSRALGPWGPELQHGGAPSALLARAVDSVEAPEGMETVRLTIELWRPLAMVPVKVVTRVERGGRTAQWVRAALVNAEGKELASAMAMRTMGAVIDPPETARGPALPHPLPEAIDPLPMPGRPRAQYVKGMDFRAIQGGFHETGPAAIWIRALGEIVEDETPTPLERVAAMADFGSGIGNALEFREWTFLNGELTIHLARPLAGEWMLLEADSWIDPGGRGLSHTVLWDEKGALGRAAQSLIVRKRNAG